MSDPVLQYALDNNLPLKIWIGTHDSNSIVNDLTFFRINNLVPEYSDLYFFSNSPNLPEYSASLGLGFYDQNYIELNNRTILRNVNSYTIVATIAELSSNTIYSVEKSTNSKELTTSSNGSIDISFGNIKTTENTNTVDENGEFYVISHNLPYGRLRTLTSEKKYSEEKGRVFSNFITSLKLGNNQTLTDPLNSFLTHFLLFIPEIEDLSLLQDLIDILPVDRIPKDNEGLSLGSIILPVTISPTLTPNRNSYQFLINNTYSNADISIIKNVEVDIFPIFKKYNSEAISNFDLIQNNKVDLKILPNIQRYTASNTTVFLQYNLNSLKLIGESYDIFTEFTDRIYTQLKYSLSSNLISSIKLSNKAIVPQTTIATSSNLNEKNVVGFSLIPYFTNQNSQTSFIQSIRFEQIVSLYFTSVYGGFLAPSSFPVYNKVIPATVQVFKNIDWLNINLNEWLYLNRTIWFYYLVRND